MPRSSTFTRSARAAARLRDRTARRDPRRAPGRSCRMNRRPRRRASSANRGSDASPKCSGKSWGGRRNRALVPCRPVAAAAIARGSPSRSCASIRRRPASSTSGRSELSSSAARRTPSRHLGEAERRGRVLPPRLLLHDERRASGTGEAPGLRRSAHRECRCDGERGVERARRGHLGERPAGRGLHGRRQPALGRGEILDQHHDPQWAASRSGPGLGCQRDLAWCGVSTTSRCLSRLSVVTAATSTMAPTISMP